MIESIPLVLTGIGIIVSILYYTRVLRNQNKTSKNAILYQRFNTSLEYQQSLQEVLWKQDWKNLEDVNKMDMKSQAKFQHILNQYNALGMLLKKKVTDPDLLMSLYTPSAILTVCKKYEPVVNQMREGTNNSRHFEGIDFLREETRAMYPEAKIIESALL